MKFAYIHIFYALSMTLNNPKLIFSLVPFPFFPIYRKNGMGASEKFKF